MRARWALITAALLCLATTAAAHRLDEYLQATTIDLGRDHVTVELRLTPGVSVAPQVLSHIDSNADGVISELERRSYADQVCRDLSLSFDGRADPLRLVSSTFADVDQLKAGVGDIELRFDADLPSNSSGHHRLTFENHHLNAIAVYLVNTLQPHDPEMRIVGQDRSYDQSSYMLDFTLGAVPSVVQAQAGKFSPQQRWHWSNELATVETYFWHGVHHIITGYDHLLFVSALVLGAVTLWDLIKVVTAFTVAHSLTLTLAALNLVHLPEAVVEPLISASIVFVAVQNIVVPDRSHGWSRIAVAFFFGLFHGLGFAGGLLDIMHQMPMGMILLAILGFSVGVEAGNQMVLLPLFGLLKAVRLSHPDAVLRARLSRSLQRIGSAGVSVAGVYYFWDALAAAA